MFNTAYLTLMVGNMDRSVRFYTEILGLPLKERFGDHWAGIQAPDVLIGLHPVGDQPATGPVGAGVSLGFMVADFDATVQLLEGRGVAFSSKHPSAGEGASSAYFSDPDGYTLYVMQRAGY